MTTEPDTTARLLITCPDQPGIVAAVTTFLYQHRVNITELDQHSTDPEGGRFFLRLEFQTPKLDVPRAALETAFREAVASRFTMDWRISRSEEHTSELQSLMRISYAVFCLKKKKQQKTTNQQLTKYI